MILLIDNYDSFTYNIVQYLEKLKYPTLTRRNDKITIAEIEKLAPSHIIVSPGPGSPKTAGISMEVIKHFKGNIPILGVCLGHQSIGAAFGADIVRARHLYHGKTSRIRHDGRGVFSGLPGNFTAARYHSLVIDKNSLPPDLIITATSEDQEIMGIRHKSLPIEGVQFHPESIASEHGYELLTNFIKQEKGKGMIQEAIKKVWKRENLSVDEAMQVMEEITAGEASPAQIAAILTSLSLKGETVDEVTGFARIMRSKATAITKPEGIKVVDTCGTGGDGSGTFNISTISAFVLAGAGLHVAKHGNRSITSKCGSADLLEGLGVNLDISPDKMTAALKDVGISFLFAQKLHASMKHAIGVRKDIGIRTVFNILGPLSNPAAADYQVIGVFDKKLTELMAKVMINLGLEHGMVVHGEDGLDEITLTAPTRISEFKGDWLSTYQFDPRKYGFDYCQAEDLKGGDAAANKQIALGILEGETGPRRDIVIINAAAAILTAGAAKNFDDAIEAAVHSLESGKAKAKLDELIRYTNG